MTTQSFQSIFLLSLIVDYQYFGSFFGQVCHHKFVVKKNIKAVPTLNNALLNLDLEVPVRKALQSWACELEAVEQELVQAYERWEVLEEMRG